jgi:two-component system chemotaxis response regulator CheY
VRILIADDAPAMRAILARLAGAEHIVIGEAQDGPRAVALAATLRPDAVFVDSRLPPDGAAPLVAEFRRAAPDTAVFVIAALGETALVRAAVAEGARGAVRRPLLAAEIRAALAGLARTHARKSEWDLYD